MAAALKRKQCLECLRLVQLRLLKVHLENLVHVVFKLGLERQLDNRESISVTSGLDPRLWISCFQICYVGI